MKVAVAKFTSKLQPPPAEAGRVTGLCQLSRDHLVHSPSPQIITSSLTDACQTVFKYLCCWRLCNRPEQCVAALAAGVFPPASNLNVPCRALWLQFLTFIIPCGSKKTVPICSAAKFCVSEERLCSSSPSAISLL